MQYKEIKQDLFTLTDDYHLLNYLSADFNYIDSTAQKINETYDIQHKLLTKYPSYPSYWTNNCIIGDCILEGKVFNLVVMEHISDKVTVRALLVALLRCKQICLEKDICKLAMSNSNKELSSIRWESVLNVLNEVFDGMNIEILICT